MADESDPLVITSNWVTRVVIGLGLCPAASDNLKPTLGRYLGRLAGLLTW